MLYDIWNLKKPNLWKQSRMVVNQGLERGGREIKKTVVKGTKFQLENE